MEVFVVKSSAVLLSKLVLGYIEVLRNLPLQQAGNRLWNLYILYISEIAFKLGFEHSQSFSKLFKSKVEMSPMEFRQSFN
jgi:AraC-like DNA-binding protein